MDAIIGIGKISKREYEIQPERNVSVLMSDGININLDVFRPSAKGQYPVYWGFQHSIRKFKPITFGRRPQGADASEVHPTPVWRQPMTNFFVRRGYVKYYW